MNSKKRLAISVALAMVASGFAGAQLDKLLQDAIKVGGAVVVADKFGGEIDQQVNRLTGFHEEGGATTKIVPILSIGSGGYVGIAQVMGPKEAVDRTQAVGQLEGVFFGKALRMKGLVPISTRTPGKSLDRVNGVGVSAIADMKL